MPQRLLSLQAQFYCPLQGRSHQIWSGQVGNAQECYTLGGSGGMLPHKILKFRGYEIASETIFVPIQCLSEARGQSFT